MSKPDELNSIILKEPKINVNMSEMSVEDVAKLVDKNLLSMRDMINFLQLRKERSPRSILSKISKYA